MGSRASEARDLPLTREERALMDKWSEFYRSLAEGTRKPKTMAQLHFVAVLQGFTEPETEHEMAYVKYLDSQRTSEPETEPGPRRASISLAEFEIRCQQLSERLSLLRAARVKGSSNLAGRIAGILARASAREYVLLGDVGETRAAERRVISMEREHASAPKPDTSLEMKLPEKSIRISGGAGGWAEHEPGTPRAGWFTDSDHGKMHGNRARELRRRNAPKD